MPDAPADRPLTPSEPRVEQTGPPGDETAATEPDGQEPDESPPTRPESLRADTSYPLSAWIRGKLTMHFAGATVERRMSLAEAQTVSEMLDDKRESDRIEWSDLKWTQFASEQVLFSDFTADEDLGWRLTPEDRATLAAHGHPHGILKTLVELWHDKGREPRYSITALMTLHGLALRDLPDKEFGSWADRLEGEAGSRLVRRSTARADARTATTSPDRSRRSRPVDRIYIDDSAEPDLATGQREVSGDSVPSGDDESESGIEGHQNEP